MPDIGLTTPKFQLKGFSKLHDIAPGKSAEATLALDKYAFSFWDESNEAWRIAAGTYGLHVGPSSDNLLLHSSFEPTGSFLWTGL